jgi:hypothetical protein
MDEQFRDTDSEEDMWPVGTPLSMTFSRWYLWKRSHGQAVTMAIADEELFTCENKWCCYGEFVELIWARQDRLGVDGQWCGKTSVYVTDILFQPWM